MTDLNEEKLKLIAEAFEKGIDDAAMTTCTDKVDDNLTMDKLLESIEKLKGLPPIQRLLIRVLEDDVMEMVFNKDKDKNANTHVCVIGRTDDKTYEMAFDMAYGKQYTKVVLIGRTLFFNNILPILSKENIDELLPKEHHGIFTHYPHADIDVKFLRKNES